MLNNKADIPTRRKDCYWLKYYFKQQDENFYNEKLELLIKCLDLNQTPLTEGIRNISFIFIFNFRFQNVQD